MYLRITHPVPFGSNPDGISTPHIINGTGKYGSASANTLEIGAGHWPDDFANAPSPLLGVAGSVSGQSVALGEARVKIGTLGLHNVAGKEAAVKW